MVVEVERFVCNQVPKIRGHSWLVKLDGCYDPNPLTVASGFLRMCICDS